MIAGKYRDYEVVFVDDKNELNQVYSKFSLLKKDGTLYKTVSINKEYNFESPLGNNIYCTLIKYKDSKILVIQNSTNFTLNPETFLSNFDNFGFKYNVTIDERKISGPLVKVENNLYKDQDGNKISFGTKSEENKELDSFIIRMKKDNGHIISPLVKRFLRTSLLFKDSRAIMAYAHLPTYFRMLKTNLDNKFNTTQEHNSKANLIINANFNTGNCKLKVVQLRDDYIDIEATIPGASLSSPGAKSAADPFLLASTRPININGNKIPFFVINMGKVPIFISVLLFKDTTYLRSIKGSIDLMKL